MKYSVIVPVFNEAGNVKPLHQAIVEAMECLHESYEIIFVNDGSRDATQEELATCTPVTVIRFRKNFGQTAALDAGFKHARGEYFITLDGDGQNPPSEIPKLVAMMRVGNFDVVSGWRSHRQDSARKHLISRGANLLRKLLIDDGIHDSGCTLKLYKRECFNDLDLFGEMHRFIPGVLRFQGFRIGEVEVEHRGRMHGTTKYSAMRIVKGLVDMISVWFWRKYSSRPLHLFGGGGLLLTMAGIFFLGALGVARVVFHLSLSRSIWPLMAVFLVLVGIQLFISGLVMEILIKHYYSNHRKPYAIANIIQR